MLPQIELIQRLKQVCQEDERLVAAMLYGSFTLGEGDRFSDLDCMLFFREAELASVDQRGWVNQVAPVELFYVNEFGNRVVIFENLVRGEFHFDPASGMAHLETFRGIVWFPRLGDTILLDRTGELAQHLQPLIGGPAAHASPEEATFVCQTWLNWYLFGVNVFKRGEHARALELLHMLQDILLRMARMLSGRTGHWISPTRRLEQELPGEAYRRYQACTAPLDPAALERAYRSSWEWGKSMSAALAQEYKLDLPLGLVAKLDRYIDEKGSSDTR